MDSVNIMRLTQLCAKDPKEIHNQLQLWGLVPTEGQYKCTNCSSSFRLGRCTQSNDGLEWVCTGKISLRKQKRKPCRNRVAYRLGTFFGGSHLSRFQILGFVNLWVDNIPLEAISKHLQISYKSSVDWASFCREVVLDAMCSNSDKLGGPGVVVEIDESKFGHRKYHRGHRVEGQWIFGGYERGTGRVFMVPVEERGADTLLPILRDWVLPGSTVISDCWGAYDCLSREGVTHLTVNYLLTFKDPETGAHTNCIEATWRVAKAVASGAGRKKDHIPGNLARYMFYKRCRQLNLDRSIEFYRLAEKLYNPVENVERHVIGDEVEEDSDGEE